MRKMMRASLAVMALSALTAVPVWADEEEYLSQDDDLSSSEYTGIKEISLGARVFPYAPLRGGVDFLWRPKWGVCAAQIESLDYTAQFNGEQIHCTGAEINFGGGIWSNMDKTHWFGYHFYFSMVWPLTFVQSASHPTKFSFGSGKSFGAGIDFYPRIWKGGTIFRGDKFVSYFADVKVTSRLLFIDWENRQGGTYSSSMLKNVSFQVGARYWF